MAVNVISAYFDWPKFKPKFYARANGKVYFEALEHTLVLVLPCFCIPSGSLTMSTPTKLIVSLVFALLPLILFAEGCRENMNDPVIITLYSDKNDLEPGRLPAKLMDNSLLDQGGPFVDKRSSPAPYPILIPVENQDLVQKLDPINAKMVQHGNMHDRVLGNCYSPRYVVFYDQSTDSPPVPTAPPLSSSTHTDILSPKLYYTYTLTNLDNSVRPQTDKTSRDETSSLTQSPIPGLNTSSSSVPFHNSTSNPPSGATPNQICTSTMVLTINFTSNNDHLSTHIKESISSKHEYTTSTASKITNSISVQTFNIPTDSNPTTAHHQQTNNYGATQYNSFSGANAGTSQCGLPPCAEAIGYNSFASVIINGVTMTDVQFFSYCPSCFDIIPVQGGFFYPKRKANFAQLLKLFVAEYNNKHRRSVKSDDGYIEVPQYRRSRSRSSSKSTPIHFSSEDTDSARYDLLPECLNTS